MHTYRIEFDESNEFVAAISPVAPFPPLREDGTWYSFKAAVQEIAALNPNGAEVHLIVKFAAAETLKQMRAFFKRPTMSKLTLTHAPFPQWQQLPMSDLVGNEDVVALYEGQRVSVKQWDGELVLRLEESNSYYPYLHVAQDTMLEALIVPAVVPAAQLALI